MTTTAWTTTGDVPAGPWATLTSDLKTLLGVMAAGGATLTNTAGTGGPSFTQDTIGFTVTLPGRGPLTVQFQRKAGTGEVQTSSAMTDGMVYAAVSRAARAWGQLLTVTSDIGTEGRAIAGTVVEALYGAGDRAVAGGAALPVPGAVQAAIAEALDSVARAEALAVEAAEELALTDGLVDEQYRAAVEAARYDLTTYLGEVAAELESHRDGVAAAITLLTPPAPAPKPTPTPAPAPAPAPSPEPVPDPTQEPTP